MMTMTKTTPEESPVGTLVSSLGLVGCWVSVDSEGRVVSVVSVDSVESEGFVESVGSEGLEDSVGSEGS